MSQNVNRREFVKRAVGAGAALSTTKRMFAANDRINVGFIGVGGRGGYLTDQYAKQAEEKGNCKIVAIADVWGKRKNAVSAKQKCDGYLDYREIINRKDIDAVVIATPDHWHAKIALEAMAAGKDVYCEKPMCHTVEEAKALAAAVRDNKRVMQVGSQTTSADQWHKAKQYIADGAIGKMLMSQGSYHRNSTEGEWNWPIDTNAGPNSKGDDFIDWKMWLGSAPERPWEPDRYFRFRKYWDYSGGIATDLFFHVVAPLQICWPEPQFPLRVSALGGIWQFKDEREVPDTFNLIADFPQGHSLVLSSCMANSKHIPGLIRGHFGTIVMVDHGMFEGRTDHITLIPEGGGGRRKILSQEYIDKFGDKEKSIPVDMKDIMQVHIGNFLDCMRTRQQPTLNVEVALRAQVTISMAVQSYRQGKILYWDAQKQVVTGEPIRA